MIRRVVLVFLFALGACTADVRPMEIGEASSPIVSCSRSTLPAVIRSIPCQPLDAAGNTLCSTAATDHFVGRLGPTDPAAQDKLVVFLTGDNSRPSQSTTLLRSFVRYGFSTIGLSYDTDHAADALEPCKEMTVESDAQACYYEHRTRRLYGRNDTTNYPLHDEVLPEDAVIPRLIALLDYLEATDPDGDWARWLDPVTGTPEYGEIIFVGWSFGAGLVTQIGRERWIQAGILLDGMKDPYDILGVVKNAPLEPGLTPGCRFFGVYDANQSEVQMIRDQWTSLGMLWSSSEDGRSVDGVTTDTIGVAHPDERRYYTEHVCAPVHSSFAVSSVMLSEISDASLPNPASTCTRATTGDYQLRELYEGMLCHASIATCTTSHDPSCVSGSPCPADEPLL
jgi:hypothetical protein